MHRPEGSNGLLDHIDPDKSDSRVSSRRRTAGFSSSMRRNMAGRGDGKTAEKKKKKSWIANIIENKENVQFFHIHSKPLWTSKATFPKKSTEQFGRLPCVGNGNPE